MPRLVRPVQRDARIVAYYTGKVLFGLSLFMAPPALVAALTGRVDDLAAIVIGIAIAFGTSRLAEWLCWTDEDLDWAHGMVTVAVSWLVGAAIFAVPLFLSGHYAGFLDAVFDAMSGLTTSGLTLIQDLDHLSVPFNLLRHLAHFAGGQGIIIVVLSVFASAGAHISTLYIGEGRTDRIVPNIVRTAQFIFLVAFVYLAVGTSALWLAGLHAGLSPGRALFHGFSVFAAAFDTGGFAPYSTSIAYYHSPMMELGIVVLMVAGTLSFALHHELWRGRAREILDNLEVRSLAVTMGLTGLVAVVGLARAGTFTDVGPLLRKGIFTLVSAHTGTGFSVSPARLFVTDWGLIAPAAVVIAMALGGMASSTAGGMKAIRVGVAAKSVLRDIRKALSPDSALVLTTYIQRHRRIIRADQVRSAITIIVLFLLTYLIGAVVGVFYGIPFDEALFESTSAAANVGLSSGVLAPDNPLPLKLTYLVQMWLGRLEFMAVFALVGYTIGSLRARLA